MDFERKSRELMSAVALRIHSDVVAITVGNLNNNEKIMIRFLLEAGGTTPVQKSHYT